MASHNHDRPTITCNFFVGGYILAFLLVLTCLDIMNSFETMKTLGYKYKISSWEHEIVQSHLKKSGS